MNDTKQRIIDEALTLFAIHGYNHVSVKQIAEAVGIRDSSIYKHFSSKQEIFDTIIETVSSQTGIMYKKIKMPDRNNLSPEYADMIIDQLEQLCFEIFICYLQDKIISKFRKMLTIEQYGNSQAWQLYHKIFIEEPLAYVADLFQQFMEAGVLKKGVPEEMAFQFYSPLFLLLYQYDHQPPYVEEIRRVIKRHTHTFADQYILKRNYARKEFTK